MCDLDFRVVDETGQRWRLHVEDAPAARGSGERTSIVDLARVRGDELTGIGVDVAPAARRAVRPMLEEAESVCVVRMTAEMAAALELSPVHAFPRRAQNARAMHRLQRRANLRWVTFGVATVRASCRPCMSSPTPSNRSSPLPRRTGTRWISISSTRPALRYCCAALAPPASATS